ncbi:MAG: hypothetical protein ABSF17_16945 [Terracidiphilus sp.]|jgi:hypothetical protein
MIFGHKSAIKNHLSSKHPTYTHHVVVKAAQERTEETDEPMETPAERNPEMQAERQEPTAIRR